MLTTNGRGARRIAGLAGIACAALLVTACSPSGGPVSPNATGSVATRTFLAQGQDLNGNLLYRPACASGCPLSGDSTAILDKMTWQAWTATEAVGTGIYKLDGCNPDCAAGPVYPVAAVVTFSDPVKFCSRYGPQRLFSHASFRFPHGLPKALQGGNGPKNPWVFSTVISAAQQSCAS